MQRWLAGREITAARANRSAAPSSAIIGDRALATLVGDRIVTVEARGKHLLVRLASERVVHTHMRMQGVWHVYTAGERWQRPARQARLVLEAGDRVAVCFNAPVVELLRHSEELAHPALRGLGPDALASPVDVAEIRARAATRPASTLIGDLLLDQQIVSGIGNIYRCEALFLAGLHPTRTIGSIPADELDDVCHTASRLMRARTSLADGDSRDASGGRWVYRRTGRPCRRCGRLIQSARIGQHARTAYWCAGCQRPPGEIGVRPGGGTRGAPDRP